LEEYHDCNYEELDETVDMEVNEDANTLILPDLYK